MLTIPNRRLGLAAAILSLPLAFAPAAHAQQHTPPPPKLDQAPCVPTKKDPCLPPAQDPLATPASAKERIPYPGDAAAVDAAKTAPANDAAKTNPFPGDSSSPESPAAGKSAPANKAAETNPFPGDQPVPSSSSSSSDGFSSSANNGLPGNPDSDADDNPIPVKPRSARRALPKVQQSAEDREAEDLDVAHTYLQMGNFRASYLRAQDAVKSIPDDPAAHFALALAAQQMKKTEEAVAEYKAYLKLEPDGDKVKQARRALAELAKQ